LELLVFDRAWYDRFVIGYMFARSIVGGGYFWVNVEWTFCTLVNCVNCHTLEAGGSPLQQRWTSRQFRSTNQWRHVVNDAVAKHVDYFDLRVRSTLRRGRRSGLCVKLRRLCGWPTEGWPHPLNDVYAAPVNEQLLIDDSSAAQPIRAAEVVTSPLTSPSPSKVNKNNAWCYRRDCCTVLCSSFTPTTDSISTYPRSYRPSYAAVDQQSSARSAQ